MHFPSKDINSLEKIKKLTSSYFVDNNLMNKELQEEAKTLHETYKLHSNTIIQENPQVSQEYQDINKKLPLFLMSNVHV